MVSWWRGIARVWYPYLEACKNAPWNSQKVDEQSSNVYKRCRQQDQNVQQCLDKQEYRVNNVVEDDSRYGQPPRVRGGGSEVVDHRVGGDDGLRHVGVVEEVVMVRGSGFCC